MGVHHGTYCLGCCWSLMIVFFVVGTMNLVWMGLLSIVIFLEKIMPRGVEIARATGFALILFGVAVALSMMPLIK